MLFLLIENGPKVLLINVENGPGPGSAREKYNKFVLLISNNELC